MLSSREDGRSHVSSSTPTQQQRSKEAVESVITRVLPCRQRTRANSASRGTTSAAAAHTKLVLLLIALLCSQVVAWGSSSNGDVDYSVYGNGFTRDWMYDGSTLSFQVLGCVWGMVEDSEEAGCLEDESEDGTYNWYMMANCRRPQVAYSVYSSTGCNSGNFVGSVRRRNERNMSHS